MNDDAGYIVPVDPAAPSTTPEDFGKAAADALTGNFKALRRRQEVRGYPDDEAAEAVASAQKALKTSPTRAWPSSAWPRSPSRTQEAAPRS